MLLYAIAVLIARKSVLIYWLVHTALRLRWARLLVGFNGVDNCVWFPFALISCESSFVNRCCNLGVMVLSKRGLRVAFDWLARFRAIQITAIQTLFIIHSYSKFYSCRFQFNREGKEHQIYWIFFCDSLQLLEANGLPKSMIPKNDSRFDWFVRFSIATHTNLDKVINSLKWITVTTFRGFHRNELTFAGVGHLTAH